jgi:hypothetical protein
MSIGMVELLIVTGIFLLLFGGLILFLYNRYRGRSSSDK